MASSTPFSRATAAFSSLETVPNTRAPSIFAIWTVNPPAPPAAACTRHESPGFRM